VNQWKMTHIYELVYIYLFQF